MTEEQFRALFAENFHDVWSFARRRTGSAPEADDVAAETFAVAWRRRDEISGEARLWLFGVARNVLSNQRRELQRRERLQRRLTTVRPEPDSSWPRTPSDDVLWEALASLSDDDRELLLLRAWDGLDVGNIAAVLGISAGTVSSRLYKAKRRLAKELQRRESGPGGQVWIGSRQRKEPQP
jgi:RNA polymerase sigma-70 factor (ECF subfamily)